VLGAGKIDFLLDSVSVGNAAQPVGAVLTQYGEGENQGSDGYGRRREEHGCRLCRCRMESGIRISSRSARWVFRSELFLYLPKSRQLGYQRFS
jgi:hypothetical protein